MRRWNPLFLVIPLFLVALLAPALVTPKRAMAAASSVRQFPASSTTFSGKVVAKNTPTNYFVFTFTCAGTLTGKWTYEVSSTQSFTGTTATPGPACELTNGSYSTTSIPLLFNGKPVTNPGTPPVPAMLSLSLTNIVASKTFFGTFVSATTGDCTSSAPGSPCVAVTTSDGDLSIPTMPDPTTVDGFSLLPGSFSTLNLSAH
jgi:hypothetical protein